MGKKTRRRLDEMEARLTRVEVKGISKDDALAEFNRAKAEAIRAVEAMQAERFLKPKRQQWPGAWGHSIRGNPWRPSSDPNAARVNPAGEVLKVNDGPLSVLYTGDTTTQQGRDAIDAFLATVCEGEDPHKVKPKPIDFDTLDYGTWIGEATDISDAPGAIGKYTGIDPGGRVTMRDSDGTMWGGRKRDNLRLLRPDEVPG
jgi:hypothetical protein